MAGESFNERLLSNKLPTVFELFAKESMESALRPAIEFIIKTICESYPERFGWMWRVKDELIALIHASVDGYFICFQNGSFAECFYGLCNVSALHNQPISFGQKFVTFLLTVGMPYVAGKLESKYSKFLTQEEVQGLAAQEEVQDLAAQEEVQDLAAQDEKRDHVVFRRMSVKFFKIFPFCHFVAVVVKLMFKLSYLVNKSQFYSPLLWVTGLVLQRTTPTSETSLLPSGLLMICAYALRVLEWWYDGEGIALQSTVTLPPPPPPQRTMVSRDTSPYVCPVCQSTHKNPSVLATSGFVFCYSCILSYIRNTHTCPLTGMHTNEQQIIRLYIQ